jgi:hypothetical protein
MNCGVKDMNTAEKIYHDVQDFPEPLALEVLHFVEFLKNKKPSNIPNETTQAAIEAGERGEYEAVTLDELKKQWDEA